MITSPIKKVDIKIANQSVMCRRKVASIGYIGIIAKSPLLEFKVWFENLGYM